MPTVTDVPSRTTTFDLARCRELCASLGPSIAAQARRIGVRRETLSLILSGRRPPSAATLGAILEATGAEYRDLMKNSPQ